MLLCAMITRQQHDHILTLCWNRSRVVRCMTKALSGEGGGYGKGSLIGLRKSSWARNRNVTVAEPCCGIMTKYYNTDSVPFWYTYFRTNCDTSVVEDTVLPCYVRAKKLGVYDTLKQASNHTRTCMCGVLDLQFNHIRVFNEITTVTLLLLIRLYGEVSRVSSMVASVAFQRSHDLSIVHILLLL